MTNEEIKSFLVWMVDNNLITYYEDNYGGTVEAGLRFYTDSTRKYYSDTYFVLESNLIDTEDHRYENFIKETNRDKKIDEILK